MNRYCEKLEALNPSERHTDPVTDGNAAGFHRQARRPRVQGSEMMSPERADSIEDMMSGPYRMYGFDD